MTGRGRPHSGSTTVVVGASLGGVRTVQALRAAGYPGRIVLVGEEHCPPYDRPPLSKAVLAGTRGVDDIVLFNEEDAREAGVRLMLGRRAGRLDVAGRAVELECGERLAYDDVVIATGASARPSPWGARTGVHELRTLADAEALRADLLTGGHLVVVGGGFIGAEVAATARALGCAVSLVDPMPTPMARVLGADVGALFARLHERHGVVTHFGVGVEAIGGERGAICVALTNGVVLDASVVVVGIGAVPNDGWLASSGLSIDDGVVCDERGTSVDAPEVHAVGDVARWWHLQRGESVRLEHWTNVVEQAGVVAHNIAHPDQPRAHAPVEYVWSDQYDWKIQIAGRTSGRHCSILGDPDSARFAVLYGSDEDGPLAGIVTVNWPRALIAARRALASGAALSDIRSTLRPEASRPPSK